MKKTNKISSYISPSIIHTLSLSRTLRTLFISQNNKRIKDVIKKHKCKFHLIKKHHSTAKNLSLCSLVCAVFDRILKSDNVIYNEGIKMGIDDILDLLKQECATCYDNEQEEFVVWEVLKDMYITLLQLRYELWNDSSLV